MVFGQGLERPCDIRHKCGVVRIKGIGFAVDEKRVTDLALLSAHLRSATGEELVSQDGDQPRLKSRSWPVRGGLFNCTQQRLLDEILSLLPIAREESSIALQGRDFGRDLSVAP